MAPLIIALVVLAFVALIGLGIYYDAKRRKALAAFAASHNLSFSTQRDHSFASRFPFRCLQAGEKDRYAFHIMTGSWHERPLTAFDYHYATTSTDSKGRRTTHHHYFSAVILSVNLPLKPLSIRAENFLDKIGEFFGADDIDFESAEFSRRFNVKSPDRRWAFDVLHARAMQFLLDQPRFTIQFAGNLVLVQRSSRFDAEEFGQAADVGIGLIDMLPDYVRQQLAQGS
jgi:hypothetical protein